MRKKSNPKPNSSVNRYSFIDADRDDALFEELGVTITQAEELARRWPENLRAQWHDSIRPAKGLVWESKFLKTIRLHPARERLFQEMDKLQERGASLGLLIMLIRWYFDESSIFWAQSKRVWTDAARRAIELCKSLNGLRECLERCPREASSRFSEFLATLDRHAGLAIQALEDVYIPSFKELGGKRKPEHQHFMLDYIVIYLEKSTGSPQYPALQTMLEIGSLCAGKTRSFDAEALRRKIQRFREEFPHIHDRVESFRVQHLHQKSRLKAVLRRWHRRKTSSKARRQQEPDTKPVKKI